MKDLGSGHLLWRVGEDNQHNKNRMAEGCGQEGRGRKLTEGPVHSESFRKPLPTRQGGKAWEQGMVEGLGGGVNVNEAQ